MKIKTELKWAAIFVLTTLAWMLLERLAGLHDTHIDKHVIVSNFFMIPAIAVYVFALLDKRKQDLEGKMTYLQGLKSGLIVTAFVSLASPLTQYVVSMYITPDYFANVIAYSVREGKMTQEAAEAYFNLKNYIIQTVIATPILGIVTSAIVTIFTRKG